MTAITTSLLAKSPQLRPLNIVRDLPGVADLVEKCFADTMDADGRNYLQQMRRAGQDNFFLRWASTAIDTVSMPLSGYVWVENGEIIGNVSLIPYRHEHIKYYLIANVAVRPDFRNKGIGRALTLTAMQHAKQHHADETWLHVRDDNPGAIRLYRSLGFADLAIRTTWQAKPDRNARTGDSNFTVTKRIARDWSIQEPWLRRIYPDLLTWYQPMPWNTLRPGLGPALYRFIAENEVHHWVVRASSDGQDFINGSRHHTALKDDPPIAVVSWQAMTGGNSRLWAAVPPEGNEGALTALLSHARKAFYWREKITLDFPAGQYNNAMEAAGFQPYRTLLWMKSLETLTDENRKSI